MNEELQHRFNSLWKQYEDGDDLAFLLALSSALIAKECPEVLGKELFTHYGKEIFDLVNTLRTGKKGRPPKQTTEIFNRRRIAAVRAAEIIIAGFQFKLPIDFSVTVSIDPIGHLNKFDLALDLIKWSYGSLISDVNWGGKRKTEQRITLETFYSANAKKPEYSLDIEMNSNLQSNLIGVFACSLVYIDLMKDPDKPLEFNCPRSALIPFITT